MRRALVLAAPLAVAVPVMASRAAVASKAPRWIPTPTTPCLSPLLTATCVAVAARGSEQWLIGAFSTKPNRTVTARMLSDKIECHESGVSAGRGAAIA